MIGGQFGVLPSQEKEVLLTPDNAAKTHFDESEARLSKVTVDAASLFASNRRR